MHTYIIEATRLGNLNYRIVASFQTDDDEKAILAYCKIRQDAEAKAAMKQAFLLRKFVPTTGFYLDGVTATNMEVLCWGDADISDIVVPEASQEVAKPSSSQESP